MERKLSRGLAVQAEIEKESTAGELSKSRFEQLEEKIKEAAPTRQAVRPTKRLTVVLSESNIAYLHKRAQGFYREGGGQKLPNISETLREILNESEQRDGY